jgi:hypothetical protein
VKQKISSLIHLVALAVWQIGKVNWCVLGDEDSSLYHSRASSRLRSNLIKSVDSDGTQFFSHKEKELIFTNFYSWCVLEDEDSSFYHSRASSRLRSNLIKSVDSDGT